MSHPATDTVSATALYHKIVGHLQSGGVVQLTTYTRSTLYSAKHASMFSVNAAGVWVAQGKKHNCIAGPSGRPLVSIRFGIYA